MHVKEQTSLFPVLWSDLTIFFMVAATISFSNGIANNPGSHVDVKDRRIWPFTSDGWLKNNKNEEWSQLDHTEQGPQSTHPTYRWAPPAPRDKVIHIERMNHQEGTGGCNIKCPSSTGMFRHPNDCSKYYTCANGQAYVGSCQYPLLFNEKERKCDWPERVGCPNPPSNFRHICGRPFGLFPHPRDCGAFYNCWGGFPHLQECSPGLMFTASKQRCEWAQLSDCGSGFRDGNIRPMPEPSPGVLVGGSETGQISSQCPSPNGQFPYPNDCERYIVCVNGRPTTARCPDNKLFEVWYERGVLHGSCLDAFRVSRTCQRTPTVSVCGYVNSIQDTMASPNYPFDYDANTDCSYVIVRAASEVCQVHLTIRDFELETSGNCENDFLQINGRQYCGKMLPTGQGLVLDFPPQTSEIRMKFKTNFLMQKRGFNILVQQKTDCSVGMPAPKYWKKVQIVFQITWNLLGNATADIGLLDSPKSLNSLKIAIIVQFVSNDRNTDNGFHIGFSQLECGDGAITTTRPPRTFKCPSRNGKFVHPERCDMYFECSNFYSFVRACPAGMLVQDPRFGSVGAVCQRADQVSCGVRSTNYPPVTIPLPTQPTPPSSFSCPISNGQFPHATFCNFFYECRNFIYTINVCPQGQLFRIEASGGFSVEFVQIPVKLFVETPPSSFSCPISNGQFPHATFCNFFYECRNFIYTINVCPQSQLFRIEASGGLQRGICSDSSQVVCGARATDRPLEYTCPRPNGQHPKQCNNFYVCNNFFFRLVTCDPGLLFQTDPNSPFREGTCLPVNQVDCFGKTVEGTTVAPDPFGYRCPAPRGLFPHSTDCDKFYNCTNGIPFISFCPQGELFSNFRVGIFETGSCLPAQNVNCGSRTTGPPTLPTPNPQDTFQCPLSNGVFRHTTDCNVYYRCINNVPVARFECPEGEIFSNLKEGNLKDKCFKPSAIFRGFKGGASPVYKLPFFMLVLAAFFIYFIVY
ncbi:Protein obstructor-E [Nymphon striatum]|nr:Protein obstructor-E [Nymphon striatum]